MKAALCSFLMSPERFRVAMGGAPVRIGLKPDLTTLAKVLCGGNAWRVRLPEGRSDGYPELR